MKDLMQIATVVLVLALAIMVVSCEKDLTPTDASQSNPNAVLEKKPGGDTASVSVFATGFNNPRGLEFGPNGFLYVAEGGVGGTDSTVGVCEQAPSPIGPYKGSPVGSRISKISPTGVVSTVVEGLPSSQTSALSGSLVSGVADVAFIDGTLYGLLSGAGCSHGVQSVPNGVFRVNSNGTWTMIADLSTFFHSHPVAHPEEDDFEPDGTPYSMMALRGDLYVVEPNHGEVDKVSTNGKVERVVDISSWEGHVVPTCIAYHGNFFVGNLGTFPVVPGTERIFKITPSGQLKIWASGLTTVLGIAFDGRDRMYVLESSTVPGEPTPNTGKVVRIDPSGNQEVIASGLFLPTGMTMGPDGNLYVSNVGYGPPPVGMGEVLKIALN